MKRRTFIRTAGISVAGLTFFSHDIVSGKRVTRRRRLASDIEGPRTALESDALRVVWEEGEQPRLLLFARTGDAWKEICELDDHGLVDVRLFATQIPFATQKPAWKAERRPDRTLILSADLGGRSLTRELEIADYPARLRIKSTLTLLGDELVEWLQDYWTFLRPGALDFAWTPSLRPDDDMVIGDHAFRAPATILMKDGTWVALVPDVETLGSISHAHTMSTDLDLESGDLPVFAYGLKAYQPVSHTYYRHADSMLFTRPAGPISYTYEMLAGADSGRGAVTRRVTSYHWQRYAAKYLKSVLPQTIPFSAYGDYSYPTLFETGEYHEFEIEGKKAGGFKALKDGGYFRRPEHVLLNQAWFNNMRSAYGLFHFGRKAQNELWQKNAEQIKNWTLSAPQLNGFFPAMYDFEKDEWWGSIPRLNGGRNRIECVNAAWTSMWLLWWNRDFGRGDDAALSFVRRLADSFVEEQLSSGAIPAWFDISPDGKEPPKAVETLKESAETAGAAMLIGELALQTKEPKYIKALTRAGDFLIREVIPDMKYWDFETFWSCSWKPLDMRDRHTGILPQNTYSAYWTVHTLLRAFEVTGERKYLINSIEALDVLNFYQQVWNPPWLDLYAFGGFGVMNTDGEWNDARQGVFAPIYLDAYRLTGEPEYFQRGVAALRAAFTLMAIPENKEVSPRTWNALPTGLCPENFAHAGYNGTFARSDSDWGEAGALAAAALVENIYGGAYIDTMREKGFGIDGCGVTSLEKNGAGFQVEVAELLGYSRKITIVTDKGRRQQVALQANQTAKTFVPVGN